REGGVERSWGRARGCTQESVLFPGLAPSPHKSDPGHDGTEQGPSQLPTRGDLYGNCSCNTPLPLLPPPYRGIRRSPDQGEPVVLPEEVLAEVAVENLPLPWCLHAHPGSEVV